MRKETTCVHARTMDELDIEAKKMVDKGWIRAGVWRSKEAPVFVQNLVMYHDGILFEPIKKDKTDG